MPGVYRAAEMNFTRPLQDIPARPNRHAVKPHLVPEQPKVSRPSPKAAVASFWKTVKIIAVFAVVLATFSMLVYERVKIMELNHQKADVDRALETAKSETVRLESLFNNKVSVDNVEEYAKNKLGMIKRNKYQIRFFMNDGEDEVVLEESLDGE